MVIWIWLKMSFKIHPIMIRIKSNSLRSNCIFLRRSVTEETIFGSMNYWGNSRRSSCSRIYGRNNPTHSWRNWSTCGARWVCRCTLIISPWKRSCFPTIVDCSGIVSNPEIITYSIGRPNWCSPTLMTSRSMMTSTIGIYLKILTGTSLRIYWIIYRIWNRLLWNRWKDVVMIMIRIMIR